MVCAMAKHVNKHLFIPLLSFLMVISTIVLSVIYYSVYKVAIESLNQRLKQSQENYIEQQNMLKSFKRFHPHHRLNRLKVINLNILKAYDKELLKYQNSIRFSKGL
jgi:hypothetical protein